MVRVVRSCVGVFFAVALTAGSGCGGSSGPPALIGPFTIADSAYNNEDASGFVFSGPSAIVAVGDYSGVCTNSGLGHSVPNSKVLAVALAAVDAAGNATPASTTGRYAIVGGDAQPVNGLYAQAFFERLDGTCHPDVELAAVAGDVTVTRLDGSGLEGDLNLTAFENSVTTGSNPVPSATGDRASGHFVAIPCPTLTFNATLPCP